MKVKYMGPSPSVNIGGYPEQRKGEIVEYNDEFAKELLKSSKKQNFVSVQDSLPGESAKKASEKQEKTRINKDKKG